VIVSHELPLDEAPSGYQHFDARNDGWTLSEDRSFDPVEQQEDSPDPCGDQCVGRGDSLPNKESGNLPRLSCEPEELGADSTCQPYSGVKSNERIPGGHFRTRRDAWGRPVGHAFLVVR
jgi:hypothetical protein